MGEVTARKRGKTWSYRFEVASQGGKRKQVERGGYKRKADALQAGAEAYAKYHSTGGVFIAKNISVADYMQEWLSLRSAELKPLTIEQYEHIIRQHIIPALGASYLYAVKPAELQMLINDLFDRGYGRHTISSVKNLLHNAFAYAVEPMQYLQQSPMQNVKLPSARAVPKVQPRSKVRRAVTREEWEQLISRFPEGTSAYLPLMLAYHCGLRRGEVFGLEWSAVDFDAHIIHIRQQLQKRGNDFFLTAPKYESSRTIYIDDSLLTALQREKQRQAENQELYDDLYEVPHISDSGFVNVEDGRAADFVLRKENGGVVSTDVARYISIVAQKKLGIESFDFHSLRHTHATMLIEAGVSPLIVQKRLGHKDIQTTLGIYAKVTEQMEQMAAEQIENIFDR